MKITFISDTHGKHHQLNLPKGEMLIHAGDVSSRGTISEVQDFLDWFSIQEFQYKIFIAGNHDFYFEKASVVEIQQIIPENVTYLNDSGITIEGINIWGSPIQPWFFDWAFNRKRGPQIQQHWDLIPTDTDILITHGPPLGILDSTTKGEHVGCKDLLKTLSKLNLKVHVFGHIHEAYGEHVENDVRFINASVLNVHYSLVNAAVEVEYEVLT